MKSSDGRFEYLDKDGDPLPDNASMAEVGRFQFKCRTDRSSHCSINLGKNAGYQVPNRSWQLTGTPDKPTITPSINCHECWHGFIKDGVFRNTSDQPEQQQ